MSQILSVSYFFPVLFLPVTLSIIYLFVYLLYLAERQLFCLNNEIFVLYP